MDVFNQARVAIGIPVGGEQVSWRFMWSVMEMDKPAQPGLIIRQGSLVDRNRNEIVKIMLSHPGNYTHLLFLDSDMMFPKQTLRQMLVHQKSVVVGLSCQRIPPFAPVVFNRVESDKVRYEKRDISSEKGLIQVASAGSGCLLIERAVFEKIAFPWFKVSWEGEEVRGEDLHFSELCYQKNIPIFVDLDLPIKHLTVGAVEKDPLSPQAKISII